MISPIKELKLERLNYFIRLDLVLSRIKPKWILSFGFRLRQAFQEFRCEHGQVLCLKFQSAAFRTLGHDISTRDPLWLKPEVTSHMSKHICTQIIMIVAYVSPLLVYCFYKLSVGLILCFPWKVATFPPQFVLCLFA